MVSFEEALKIVLEQAASTGNVRVPLSDSPGRVLAEDIFSDTDMPPFHKSAVDGFACRTEDFRPAGDRNGLSLADPGKTWKIVETIPAGKSPGREVGPGECSRIMTGAMIPAGADCVVMVEDSSPAGKDRVSFTGIPAVPNICFQGEDIRKGALVLEKGLRIRPAHVAVLAGMGIANPVVAAMPRVGIIATGDELVEPSQIPVQAQIRNSNGWQLEAQVMELPALPVYLGIARDNGDDLTRIIGEALEKNDVILLTGGVSMGDYDYVPGVLRQSGIRLFFEKIAIQPGKPTVFGRKGNTFVFGLPGNPVSSFVLFEMLVKPFLFHMMGHRYAPAGLILPMGQAYSRKKSSRKSMVPVVIKDGLVFPVDYHGSAHIHAYTKADAILAMEIGTTEIQKGEQVHVRPL